MDKIKVIERLMALASNSEKRSKAAQLEDVIEIVEIALSKGVPRTEIIKDLAESGLDFTIYYFDTALKRIRKKRKVAANKATKTTQTPSPAKQTETKPETETVDGITEYPAHDPRAITQILGSLDDLAKYAPKRKKP